MAETVGSHTIATFTSPVNGTTPIDANTVRGNDNVIQTAYNAHDTDTGIHVQSSALASRPAAGTAGRKWVTVDGTVQRLWYDTGSVWLEVQAAALSTARTLWGQSFDGSANVSGSLSSVTDIGMSGTLTIGSDVALSRGAANRLDLATGDNLNLVNGAYLIGAASVLSATTLGSGVVNSSLTSVGTLTSGAIGSGFSPIANSALANSSVTVNGVSIALGASGTVAAAASTLTGTTLASNVVNSSLTSVGTLVNLTVTNPISGSVTGSAGSVAASALTGSTLASGVTASSLTSVGTLGSLTVSGNTILGAEVFRSADNSFMRLAGGNPSATGAALVLFGSTHATAPGRIDLNAVGTGTFNISTGGAARASIDASGNLAVDTNTLFVDATNNCVGVGTSSPNAYGAFAVFSAGIGLHNNSTSGAAGLNLYEGGSGRFSLRTLNGSAGLSFFDSFNGVERARIDASGNLAVDTNTLFVDAVNNRVGVGTASPSNTLHVIGTSRLDGAVTLTSQTTLTPGVRSFDMPSGGTAAQQFMHIGLAGGDAYIGTAASTGGGLITGSQPYALEFRNDTGFSFGTGLTEKMRLDASGNLGLGVTPSAWSGVGSALEMKGGGYIGSATNLMVMTANTFFNGVNFIYKTSSQASRYEQFNGAHAWYTAASGTAGDPITFTQAMTLDANGYLAIGTTTTTSARVNIQNSDALNEVVFRGTDYTNILSETTGGMQFGITSTTGTAALAFLTLNTERARIKSGGQVRFIPLAAAPGGAEDGDVYYDSGTNKLRVRAGGAWVDLH